MRLAMTILGLIWLPHTVAAQDMLRTLPLQFIANNQVYSGKQILPTGDHPLNKMAEQLAAEFDGAEVVVPQNEFLATINSKAAYSYKLNVLYVSEEVIKGETLDPAVQSEMIRVALWAAFRHGKPSPWSGFGHNWTYAYLDLPHGRHFDMSEVVASIFSVKYYSGARDIASSRKYLSHLRTMLSTISQALHQGTLKPTRKPEMLGPTYKNRIWNEMRTKKVNLNFPVEITEADFQNQLSFSDAALRIIEDAEASAKALEFVNPDAASAKTLLAHDFFINADKLLQLFETQFKTEAALFNLPKNYSTIVEDTCAGLLGRNST